MFVRKIDLGHILVILSMLAAFALGYGKFEQRLQYLENTQAKLVQTMANISEVVNQNKFFREEYQPRVRALEREKLLEDGRKAKR